MKVIKNGKVLTENGLQKVDIQFDENRIIAIGENLDGDEIVDAHGLTVLPGLVDVHVHLRQPGREQKGNHPYWNLGSSPWWIYLDFCDAQRHSFSG